MQPQPQQMFNPHQMMHPAFYQMPPGSHTATTGGSTIQFPPFPLSTASSTPAQVSNTIIIGPTLSAVQHKAPVPQEVPLAKSKSQPQLPKAAAPKKTAAIATPIFKIEKFPPSPIKQNLIQIQMNNLTPTSSPAIHPVSSTSI